MTAAAVGTDFLEALDLSGGVAAQFAFNLHALLDVIAQLVDLELGQVLDPDVAVNTGFFDDEGSLGVAYAEDIGKGDEDALIVGERNSCDTCHTVKLNQPWRCLCLGFLQMTQTRRFRRTITHSRQIFLTDERTFMFLVLEWDCLRKCESGRLEAMRCAALEPRQP